MFSTAVERVLEVAFREALVRRHAYLTLEHLLFALAHEPTGERILRASGAEIERLRAELKTILEEGIERLPSGSKDGPSQTIAFRRVLQAAVLHVQSAGRSEADIGDLVAALLQQPKSQAATLLATHGVTRLDVLNFISHGVAKVPLPDGDESAQGAGSGEEPQPSRDPLTAFTVNLTERARSGALDPLIGRTHELTRALEILCRRRKNNPVFVGDAGVGKTALVEGLAQRLLADDIPAVLKGAEIFALDTKSASRRSWPRSRSGPSPSCSSTRCTP